MKELELSVQDIKDLMESFCGAQLGELEIQQGDFRLKLKGQKVEQVILPAAMAHSPTGTPATVAGQVIAAAPASEGREAIAYNGRVVTSPIVGTFYNAPAPDSDPYVRVGSRVQKGDVLFIIESMKLMNEVTSDYDGTVAEILVENAQGVEYGQPLLVID